MNICAIAETAESGMPTGPFDADIAAQASKVDFVLLDTSIRRKALLSFAESAANH